jgi:hypothetical protein
MMVVRISPFKFALRVNVKSADVWAGHTEGPTSMHDSCEERKLGRLGGCRPL